MKKEKYYIDRIGPSDYVAIHLATGADVARGKTRRDVLAEIAKLEKRDEVYMRQAKLERRFVYGFED